MVLTNKTPEKKVYDLFTRVAPNYDRMNDLISLGVQRRWRRIFFKMLGAKKSDRCLDLCCGGGELTIGLAERAATVVGLDFNESMLRLAEKKIMALGLQGSIQLVQGDAMKLPFRDESFDCVTIGFGLRNVPDAGRTVREAWRVLKPGGKFGILEMSQPVNPLVQAGWRTYFRLFPYLAHLTGASASDYRYLARTSREFLTAVQLKELLLKSGFRKVKVEKLLLGAGAIHIGIK